MAYFDIFREQLAIRYPSHGHALWQPSPRYPDKPVQVGDVGFISKGKFRRLFNALLPKDDPSHECGVPEYYEPLIPKLSNHLEIDSLGRGDYSSAGVSVEPDPAHHARSGDLPQVTFKSKTRAAVLSLPVNARREDTLSNRDFKLWIVKHIDSWFAFARNLGLEIERMEEIILVTGCDRTKSWANIAFLGNQDDSHVSFGVEVGHPDPSITFQYLPGNVQGAVLHHGPEGENLSENQCVFIRGYRAARTFWKLPKRVKAAAGPSTDPDGYDCDPDTEAISIPAITKYRDPLYILLDYIAKEASDCDMVVAHDDDLVKVEGLGHESLLETLEPNVMMDLLRWSNMEIHKVPCVSATDNGPNTDIVKVAMVLMESQDSGHDIGSLYQGSPLTQNKYLSCASELRVPGNFPVPTIRGHTNALQASLTTDHGDSTEGSSRFVYATSPNLAPFHSPPYPQVYTPSPIPQAHSLPYIQPASLTPDVYIHPALAAPSLLYDMRSQPSHSNPRLTPAVLSTPAVSPPLPSLALRIGDLPWLFTVFPDARTPPGDAFVTVQDVLVAIYFHLRTAVKGDEYEAMSKAKQRDIFRAFESRVGTDPVQHGKGLRRVDFLGGRFRALGLVRSQSNDSVWDVVIH